MVTKWATLHILQKAVSSHPTGSEWHCTFCKRLSDHIFSYDQQYVSDISHFMKGSLITSFPANRKWVRLHILWKAVWSHLFLWPTACEWYCTFCKRQCHHIFSYDQQLVSGIAHFVKGTLIICIFPYDQQYVSDISHFVKGSLITSFLPIGSEWHCTFCERQSDHIFSYDQQLVSEIAHFVKDNLITSFPMANSLWVTLHILWKVVWSHLFLWPTGSEWHCTFCERQSHHIFSHGQQVVSDITYFVKSSLITSFLWATGCECHCTFQYRRESHQIHSCD